eukprot:1935698-Amphidinium_carterae.1
MRGRSSVESQNEEGDMWRPYLESNIKKGKTPESGTPESPKIPPNTKKQRFFLLDNTNYNFGRQTTASKESEQHNHTHMDVATNALVDRT